MSWRKTRCENLSRANGVLELFNCTSNSMLGKVISESQRNWVVWLPQIMSAYRVSHHSANGYSPKFLVFGLKITCRWTLLLAIRWSWRRKRFRPTNSWRTSSFVWWEPTSLFVNAYKPSKDAYNMDTRQFQFEPGESVRYYPWRYSKIVPYRLSRQFFHMGSYTVVNTFSAINYNIRKSLKDPPFVVHVDTLECRHSRSEESRAVYNMETVINIYCDLIPGMEKHMSKANLPAARTKKVAKKKRNV